MVNKDLQRIISVIATKSDIDEDALIHGKTYKAVSTRKIISLMLKNYYPNLILDYLILTNQTKGVFYKTVYSALILLEKDTLYAKIYKNTLKDLNHIKSRMGKEKPTPKRDIFGIGYSVLDEIKIERSIKESIEFMRTFGVRN